MASIVKPCLVGPPTAWIEAARLIARWLAERERIDRLLEALPSALSGVERARCQHLVMGVVRNAGRLEAALRPLFAHPPRFITRAVLFVAGYELLDAGPAGAIPQIVHHAVAQARALASEPEARLVNAVLRRLSQALNAQAAPPRIASAEELAAYFSHPDWLVRRWLAQHGAAGTRALLEWNQRPAVIYARVRPGPAGVEPEVAAYLKPTPWAGFFEVAAGHWAEIEPRLKDGRVYLQDPVTRLPVDLLAPLPGESVLDVCAAPGGKSLLIADRLAGGPGKGLLVAMDLPGERIARLRENLATVTGVDTALVEGDATAGAAAHLKARGLPESYPAVLVDVPCSNTGVMRHRADVKWRLQEGDFRKHSRQQLALLEACSRLVAPGGRLVYSTCSIDTDENQGVITAFLKNSAGRFALESKALSLPWVTGHDGAAAFLLRRGV